jgi:hypothetical protein
MVGEDGNTIQTAMRTIDGYPRVVRYGYIPKIPKEAWTIYVGRYLLSYPPSFYMHLKDPHAHWEMIEGLESRDRVEEFNFNTIFGAFQGHRIFASEKVAEKIEKQTRYAAEVTT